MTGPAASRRLGLTALAAAAGVLIVYLVLVRTSAGQQLDDIGAVHWVDPDADFAGACVLVVAAAAASVAALLRARATA